LRNGSRRQRDAQASTPPFRNRLRSVMMASTFPDERTHYAKSRADRALDSTRRGAVDYTL